MVSNLLTQKQTGKRELTERQETFVDTLLHNGGNVDNAMKLAGYKPSSRQWLVNSVKDEVLNRTEHLLALNSARAAQRIITTIDDDGTEPRAEIRLKAAESLLNRVGLGRKDTVQHNVTALHGVVLLPSKKPVQEVVIEQETEQ